MILLSPAMPQNIKKHQQQQVRTTKHGEFNFKVLLPRATNFFLFAILFFNSELHKF